MRIQYCSDVEIVFLLSNSFSDIGAHQDFEMPEFFMPKLLIKEQWYNVHPYTGQVTFYKVPETHGLVTLYVNIFYNLLIDNRI